MKMSTCGDCCGRVIRQRLQWPGGGAVMKWTLIAVRLLGDCVYSSNEDFLVSGASHKAKKKKKKRHLIGHEAAQN